jgi:hypothetical protein
VFVIGVPVNDHLYFATTLATAQLHLVALWESDKHGQEVKKVLENTYS